MEQADNFLSRRRIARGRAAAEEKAHFLVALLRTERLLVIFAAAFLLNVFWEHLHAPLYASYEGGPITEFILFRAALGDGVLIACLAAPFLWSTVPARRGIFLAVAGVIVGVAIEKYALASGRWTYGAAMPIVPFVAVGLSPALELGVTGYLAFRFALAVIPAGAVAPRA